jgi:hypothetical protein
VSADGRNLLRADGRPFFYLADTAWSIFHRLTREEADLYLRNRAAKGFTVVQAVALSENDGLRTPNAYGERPLAENDPRRPSERYFAHVDWVIDRARRSSASPSPSSPPGATSGTAGRTSPGRRSSPTPPPPATSRGSSAGGTARAR